MGRVPAPPRRTTQGDDGVKALLADLAVGFYNATPLCVALLIILFP